MAWAIGIPLTYLIGYVACFRWTFQNMMVRAQEENRRDKCYSESTIHNLDDIDRPYLLAGSLLVALIWPLYLPVKIGWNLLLSSKIAQTPIDLAEREREELDRLRRQAREYNLPMGDEK